MQMRTRHSKRRCMSWNHVAAALDRWPLRRTHEQNPCMRPPSVKPQARRRNNWLRVTMSEMTAVMLRVDLHLGPRASPPCAR